MPWPYLALLIVAIYLFVNSIFAVVYMSLGDAIAGARPGVFSDAFFFSVETLATLGGRQSPKGISANLVQMVEVLTGFSFFALSTALLFAKFSRPTARVMFSNVAVIAPYGDAPHFMFRVTNERGNHIADASMQVVLVRKETGADGAHHRHFIELPLVLPRVPFLQIKWTGRHRIDEKSPLYGLTIADLQRLEAEIIVSLTGLEETFSEDIHARYSYVAEEIRFGMVFEDMLSITKDNRILVSYNRFHKVKPFELVKDIPDDLRHDR